MGLKNHCPMDVPLHLSLQEQEYCLYAVINHSGSRFRGHYTAVSRSLTDNKWYCFDDRRVTEQRSGAHSKPQLEVSAALREAAEQNDQDKSPYYQETTKKKM
ncbi:hypothetical protein G5714_001231 [Onychostoma macrolepis]|uniref:ubiquitinyl hydrolase 1 n=1 Tax=Onychostoma macrolepis TaxID=369639 RepID=A0A7J6DIU0_9TELE|nr:hypothetical protein G5714_001231 [Onychostoma macrolepis]